MLLHRDKYVTKHNSWYEITQHFSGRHGNQLDRDVLAPTCHLVHITFNYTDVQKGTQASVGVYNSV